MPTLCFIHIPKTAGSSIRFLTEKKMPDKRYWFGLPDMPPWDALSPTDLSDYELVAGHLTRSEFDRKVLGDKVYMSFVRDPLERVVSLFEYIINGWDEQPWRAELSEKGLLWAIEHHDGFRSQANNEQCWYVSGERAFEPAFESLNNGKWIVTTMADCAVAWREACRLMHWSRMRFTHANAGRRGYYQMHVTPAVVEAVQQLNSEDQKLFDYVKAETAGRYDWWDRVTSLI